MAAGQPTRRPTARTPFGSMMSQLGEVDALRRAAEAKGRELYEAAIRTGRPIAARTAHDLVELGARALLSTPQGALTKAAVKATANVIDDPKRAWAQTKKVAAEGVHQAAAAGRGAIDAGTFGAADYVSSGARALIDSHGDIGQLGTRFQRRLNEEKARDAYDVEHYGAARKVGEIGAIVGETFLLGPAGGIARGVQLARAAPAIARGVNYSKAMAQAARAARTGRSALSSGLTTRELASLAVIGGAAGGAERWGVDQATGRRSTPEEYVASIGGGALQAVAAPRMGVAGNAALGAGATSVLEDALTDQRVSPGRAASAAAASGILGHYVGRLTEDGLDRLSANAKGKIGEFLSEGRTLMRGGHVTARQQPQVLNNGRTTVIDHENSLDEIVEAKLRKKFSLSPAQRAAMNQFGDRYRIDHFLLRDLGLLAGAPTGRAAGELRMALDLNNKRDRDRDRDFVSALHN